MSPDAVEILRERIDRKTIDEQQEQGFGLWNVNQRVKLYYGEAIWDHDRKCSGKGNKCVCAYS